MRPCLCNGFLQLASFKVREGDRKLREKGIRRIIAHGPNNRFELSVGGLRRKELDEKEIVSAGSDVKRVLAGLIFGAQIGHGKKHVDDLPHLALKIIAH